MKYLLVVLIVVIVGWLLLRGSRPRRADREAPSRGQPLSMVECRHCGVHLPRGDAVEDLTGAYCSEAHRLAGPR